jgi:hypothetical protein
MHSLNCYFRFRTSNNGNIKVLVIRLFLIPNSEGSEEEPPSSGSIIVECKAINSRYHDLSKIF